MTRVDREVRQFTDRGGRSRGKRVEAGDRARANGVPIAEDDARNDMRVVSMALGDGVGRSGDSRAAGAGTGNVSSGSGRRALLLYDGACERLRERKRGCGEGCDPGQRIAWNEDLAGGTATPSFARRGKRGRRSSARARRTHVSARSLSDCVVQADLRRGKGSKGHSSPRASDVARVICARLRARSNHGAEILASGRGASERTGSMYRLNDASAATGSTFTSRGISTALHLLRG